MLSSFLVRSSLVFVGCVVGTAQAAWEKSEQGETAVFKMQNAPYPHESRKEGFKGRSATYPRDPHYIDNSVAIFIPKGYKPQQRTDLVVYLHGHGNHIAKALEQYKLREQVVASGKNVIFVFPEGPKNASDSGCGKLEERDGLKKLLTEVMETLVAEGKVRGKEIGRVLLTGHSGAYLGLSFCVKHGGMGERVTEVGLLDASYDLLDPFVAWVAGHPKARLFSIFTDHLAADNVYMMTEFRKRRIAYELLDDQEVKPEDQAKNRILFVHTLKLTHDQTVQWLESWLRASSLEAR
ncbi:MAG: hypothetical protein KA354_18070 [Phycisphaerae bacterium]|nr:hypothetical protein [Phycisphaerae bacterium]